MLDPEFEDTVFNFARPQWSPIGVWKVSELLEPHPHVMFTMRHDLEGDENRLLRGEVLRSWQ